jgi:holliday junction DNA helicase RuvA
MIYTLTGEYSGQLDDSIVIETGGIGYQVYIPETITPTLPPLGEGLKLYIYHHIREDQQVLFGFLREEDRKLFTILTSVSGVGPKIGLKILSAATATDLVQLILSSNISGLIAFPGVGKKMAERIILELKDKLANLYGSTLVDKNGGSGQPSQMKPNNDLTLALQTLGYNKEEIKRAIQASGQDLNDSTSIESGIKVLLKHL